MTGKKMRNRILKYLIFFVFILLIVFYAYHNLQKAIYPVKYKELVIEYSSKYNLDPYLIFAMIKVESDFKPDAVSRKNARGLLQISEKTGKWGAEAIKLESYSTESLFDPGINLNIGCWYMHNLINEFGGSMDLALAAYNGGSGNVREWLKDRSLSASGKSLDRIPFRETENYLKKVRDCMAVYKKLYENGF